MASSDLRLGNDLVEINVDHGSGSLVEDASLSLVNLDHDEMPSGGAADIRPSSGRPADLRSSDEGAGYIGLSGGVTTYPGPSGRKVTASKPSGGGVTGTKPSGGGVTDTRPSWRTADFRHTGGGAEDSVASGGEAADPKPSGGKVSLVGPFCGGLVDARPVLWAADLEHSGGVLIDPIHSGGEVIFPRPSLRIADLRPPDGWAQAADSGPSGKGATDTGPSGGEVVVPMPFSVGAADTRPVSRSSGLRPLGGWAAEIGSSGGIVADPRLSSREAADIRASGVGAVDLRLCDGDTVHPKPSVIVINPNLKNGSDGLSYQSTLTFSSPLNSHQDCVDSGRLHVGKLFNTMNEARSFVKIWSDKNLSPMIIKSSSKGSDTKNGRILYACPHGIQRKISSTGQRPKQNVLFCDCRANIYINEQRISRKWVVTSLNEVHTGHMTGPDVYGTYLNVRKMSPEDEDFLMNLHSAGAANRCSASVLSQRNGNIYKTQDIYNKIEKLKNLDLQSGGFEKGLYQIEEEGGTVLLEEDEWDKTDVLFIQLKQWHDDIEIAKPTVFQLDSTFGTNRQGYKLNVPVYKSSTTGMYEVAGLMFMATENQENVEKCMSFFKETLTHLGNQDVYFFVDKDFSQFEMIYKVFEPKAQVYLDWVHVDR